jgi:hypothetical protein
MKGQTLVGRKNSVKSMCAVDSIDWRAIVSVRPNILLCGDKPFTGACLSALRPYCPAPVETLPRPEVGALSAIREGAVILEDIHRYSCQEQRGVFDWLEQSDVQLITTTETSLLNLIKRGRFIEQLYYRLNIVYLDLPLDHYDVM